MPNENEELWINVPLCPATKAWLESRAGTNNRATCREATDIIERERRKDEKQGGKK